MSSRRAALTAVAQRSDGADSKRQPSPLVKLFEFARGRRKLPSDRDFAAMRSAYQPTGGSVRRDALARVLHDRQSESAATLGKLLVTHEVFSYEWRRVFWVPLFQFDLRDLSIRPAPRTVLTTLAGVFNGWELGVWFAQPNVWLRQRRPVELLDSDLRGVLAAARLDRFIATG